MVLKHSCFVNGYDVFNLTKLDVLDDLDEIKIGIEYIVDGESLSGFPGMSSCSSAISQTYGTPYSGPGSPFLCDGYLYNNAWLENLDILHQGVL